MTNCKLLIFNVFALKGRTYGAWINPSNIYLPYGRAYSTGRSYLVMTVGFCPENICFY